MSLLVWGATLISGFIIVFALMPSLIRYFRARKEGQMIREEGPKWHEKKSGTPTMGGLLFIIAILVTTLWVGGWQHQLQPTTWILMFILVLYGALGFWDDSIKLWRKQNEGLKAWQKLLGQVIGAVILTLVYQHEHLPMALRIPGLGVWSLGIWYMLFAIIWLVGFSNAVNLTDGLDGLVAGQATIAFGAYAVIAYAQNQYNVKLFCLAVVGSLLGFFVYNHKPAKIFMGDMGSLALGGALAAVSILLHHELSLLLIGIIFVIETASVILQVASFKLTGKRIFLMSPIHHHFEMKGWSEWKIDIVFWSIGLVAAVISVATII
ncbi:phospho-N-acetylmuramoyl-pentapeptide- transferase [Lactiplantibacillus plantarum]|nr:phospho-N-acetylmuramoyl-pentapeptide- transferase [Lactiplantibacillus plantarum]MCG0617808.1 phospho-N-acetylmuramoyl-pentapeptide- transferase [Lactiplantibacillus plantarum]MCG0806242.1 phospho-N-acetylmuramoyl-pentapeptide- transferase [Lactiplantibacillus plantarum]MCG0831057.1 phospho-N-acetylmuramoyl-pentapeptide- transferase [Lactiplantibacillus plantarum]MCG0850009.1 phospho-N-acetylmuramoyl-pentapeptide- transferase [Lactiplantibacillus plantarum]